MPYVNRRAEELLPTRSRITYGEGMGEEQEKDNMYGLREKEKDLNLDKLKVLYVNKFNKLKYNYALKNLSDINYFDIELYNNFIDLYNKYFINDAEIKPVRGAVASITDNRLNNNSRVDQSSALNTPTDISLQPHREVPGLIDYTSLARTVSPSNLNPLQLE